MRVHVDPRQPKLSYWAKVIGKALASPAVQVVVMYRISHVLYQNRLTRPFSFLLRSAAVVWGGTEIHPAAEIGPGLCLVHSQKILIAEGVRIGRNARISHGVSIGGDTGRGGPLSMAGWPTIGNNVTIALDSIVLGALTIGDEAFIGAQSFVVKDVPPRCVAMGSPARVVRKLTEEELDLIAQSDLTRPGD
ncbi:hypothetical protein SFC88_04160 [Nocardioides sp. HM23]|uniref:serine O-acetyltransferase n=1 Tax=Nocardioides bizhenqiangii TaxID=3095076 RepID=UPI002ACA36B6|nr:hypothetical protein [Nocardioides sp. HM23]MDZ5620001.1 hypothetical protein [Nocardioides sp. HM23]